MAEKIIKKNLLEGNNEIGESCPFPVKYDKFIIKGVDLKGKNVMTDILS